jgi:hypothetical protein
MSLRTRTLLVLATAIPIYCGAAFLVQGTALSSTAAVVAIVVIAQALLIQKAVLSPMQSLVGRIRSMRGDEPSDGTSDFEVLTHAFDELRDAAEKSRSEAAEAGKSSW